MPRAADDFPTIARRRREIAAGDNTNAALAPVTKPITDAAPEPDRPAPKVYVYVDDCFFGHP